MKALFTGEFPDVGGLLLDVRQTVTTVQDSISLSLGVLGGQDTKDVVGAIMLLTCGFVSSKLTLGNTISLLLPASGTLVKEGPWGLTRVSRSTVGSNASEVVLSGEFGQTFCDRLGTLQQLAPEGSGEKIHTPPLC